MEKRVEPLWKECDTWLMRAASDLRLISGRVASGRLLAAGFRFELPGATTRDLMARWRQFP
jgi:hypothetical protein